MARKTKKVLSIPSYAEDSDEATYLEVQLYFPHVSENEVLGRFKKIAEKKRKKILKHKR